MPLSDGIQQMKSYSSRIDEDIEGIKDRFGKYIDEHEAMITSPRKDFMLMKRQTLSSEVYN